MKDKVMKIYLSVQAFRQESGQDLIEYALAVALIALAATAGMSTLAHEIHNAFSLIGSTASVYTT